MDSSPLKASDVIADPAVAHFAAQHTLDQDVIATLLAGGRVDRGTIVDLEAVGATDQAVIAQMELDGIIDREKIANLEIALVSARRIGAAIGIIMAIQKVAEEQAFSVLRDVSQNTNRKLRDVADDVLLVGAVRSPDGRRPNRRPRPAARFAQPAA